MPLIACPNKIDECLPCLDDPIRNISAEDPDRDRFIGVNYFQIDPGYPPLNWGFRQTGCKLVCYSLISQEDADDCARRLAELCEDEDIVSPDGPLPDGSPGPLPGIPITTFLNTQQTQTVTCPDGTEFSWTIEAGTFVAFNQALANAIAASVARNRAIQHRICILSSALSGGCRDEEFSVEILAVGGTALFFPYLNPPFSFIGCGSGFQPIPYTWQLISGSLPPGLELDECTGQITGTPTATGNYTFTVRATDAIGSFQQKTLTLCVIRITTASALPDANEDEVYVTNLAQTPGAVETESWAIVSGSLPAGLELSNAGVISGTPEETGDFSFRVRVVVGSC